MMPLCENKIAMMERRLQECEIAAAGLDGVAEQQYRSRVHRELAAIQDARNQQVRLDEVISVEQCVKHTVVPSSRLMPQIMIVNEHTRIIHSTR